MNSEDITLSEKRMPVVGFHLYKVPKMVTFVGIGSRMVVVKAGEEQWRCGV